jgi:inner membrane protein
MKYYTHLAFSFLIGLILIKYFGFSNQILFMILFLLFSLLPDIDKIGSKVSKKFKVISFFVNIFIGHRGLVHSILIPVILYLILFLIRMDIAIAASFGYLSHLVLDCFNVSGVKLFWPFPKKIKGFVKVGSLTEYLIFIGLLIVDVYLLISF